MYYRCANIREEVVTEAAAVVRTAYQQIYEIAAFSDRMSDKYGERLSAKRIAKLYQEHVVQSKAGKTEMRSERMIDDALTIARRGLANAEVEIVLRRSDERWGHGSPFNSVAKIQGLISKCQAKQLVWVFQSIEHLALTEQMEASAMSLRFVLGESGRVGYLDVLLMKYRLLQHMTNSWLPSKGCSGEVLSVLHEKVMTPSHWRVHVCPHDGPVPSMTWKKEWGRSMDLYLQFVEVAIYGTVFETHSSLCSSFSFPRLLPVELIELLC